MRWVGNVEHVGGEDLWVRDFGWKCEGERESLENLGIYGRMLKKYYWTVWIEFIWLRMGGSGGIFWSCNELFGSIQVQEISWQAEELLASTEGLCSMKLVNLVDTVFWISLYWSFTSLQCLLGIAYSMLASALWPMVALVIPEYQLGTAYGM